MEQFPQGASQQQQPSFIFDFHRVIGIFMELDTPKDFQGSNPRWGGNILLRKDNPQEMEVLKRYQAHLWNFAQYKWPGMTEGKFNEMKKPLKDGANDDPSKYPEVYRNSWIVSGYRSLKQGKPRLVQGYDWRVAIPNEQADEIFTDGTIVCVSYEAYFPKSLPVPQICNCLMGVQYVKKGEAIGKGNFDPEGHFQNYDDCQPPGTGAPNQPPVQPNPFVAPAAPAQVVNQGFGPGPAPSSTAVPGWGG